MLPIDPLLRLHARIKRVLHRPHLRDRIRQFQQIVERDLPDINLVSPQFITIYNRKVHDHSLTADGVEGNLSGVWLDKGSAN